MRRSYCIFRSLGGVVLLFLLVAVLPVSVLGQDLPAPERPAIQQLKSLNQETVLVQKGHPQAVIAVPSSGEHDEAANRIRRVIREMTGVELPVVTEQSARTQIPFDRHVIVLGNRSTNPTTSRLYDRHYTLLDAKYPGSGGYVVRTLHNPFGNGYNVVLVGGSDRGGIDQATSRLVRHLRTTGAKGSGLTIGWFWDVKVSDTYALPEVGDASANVPHWGESTGFAGRNQFGWNALSRNMALYYMTGKEKYAHEFLRLNDPDPETQKQLREWDARAFQRIEDPLSHLHHYNQHKAILYWNLIEESPVFTDKQRLAITRSLARDYEHRIGEEFYELTQPNHDVGGRHQQYEALAQLVLARYFRKYYPDPFWDQAYEGAANNFRALYHTPQLGGTEAENAYFYASYFAPSIEYVLLTGDRDLLKAGPLTKIIRGLEMIHSGLDQHWALASCALNQANKIAYLTGEGQWLTYRRRMKMDTNTFRIGQSYWPADLKPRQPRHLVDRWAVNPMAHPYWEAQFSDIPEDNAFLWASWRSAPDAGGDFILLDGHDGGSRNRPHFFAVPELRIDGQTILQGRSWTRLGHLNQVRTYADAMVGPKIVRASSLADTGQVGSTAFVRGRVEGLGYSNWDRYITQRIGEYAVFVDVITATRQSQNFEIQTLWQGAGARWNGDDQVVELPGRGENPPIGRVKFSEPVQGNAQEDNVRLLQRQSVDSGDTIVNVSLVYPDGPNVDEYASLKLDRNRAVILTPRPSMVSASPSENSLTLFSEKHFFGFQVTEWNVRDRMLLSADAPVFVDWNLIEGDLAIRSDHPVRVRYRAPSGVMEAMEVDGTRLIRDAELSDGLRGLLKTVLNKAVREGWAQRQVDLRSDRRSKGAVSMELASGHSEILGGPVNIIRRVLINGEVRFLVAAGSDLHVVSPDGSALLKIETESEISAVEYWQSAAGSYGEVLLVTGHMDQMVHAWTLDGDRVWSHETEEAEELLATGMDFWFQGAHPGVRGLKSHPDFYQGSPTLFVGSATTMDLLDPEGTLRWRNPTFWGIPQYFQPIPGPKGSTTMLIGKNPSDDMGVIVFNQGELDTDRISFEAVPEGHTQITNWARIKRRHIFYKDMSGDGDREVISELTGFWNRVTIWEDDGTPVANAQFGPGKRIPEQKIRDFFVSDANGDGRQEAFVATIDGYIVMLDHNLELVWSRHFAASPELVTTVATTDGDHTIVTALANGQVVLLNAAGETVARMVDEGGPHAIAADNSSGTVLVGSDNGRLVILRPETALSP